MLSPERELQWLRRVRDLSQRLASEVDLERLLPLILDAAIEITEAERGFLVLAPPGTKELVMKEARGFDKQQLAREAGKVSRRVVERVLKKQTGGLVTSSEEDADALDVSSVKAHNVVSILSVPLRLRGETRGVIYLDHSITKGAFSEVDLQILQPFADQAAVALETSQLLAEQGSQPAEGPGTTSVRRFGRLVGGTPAMGALYEEIDRAARSWAPVLILGEQGTGKELVAREIHDRSQRARSPFLTLSCEKRESPIEGELLGQRKGARPWATVDSEGLLVLAGEGTLFLESIDALTPELQLELVSVLRRAEVTPVGGKNPRPVQCRVIATSQHDLRALETFRDDLYYQLDVARVIVPPLRQRTDDIVLLLDHFARRGSDRASLPLTPHALKLLKAYTWPGNVRELENEALRLIAHETDTLTAKHLSPEIQEGRGVTKVEGNYAGMTLSEVEREMVRSALEECDGNKARTARKLGVPRSTLYHLLERHGL